MHPDTTSLRGEMYKPYGSVSQEKKESLSVFASICLNLWPQSLCFFLSLSLWPENTSGFERKGNSLERLQLFLSFCLTFRHTFPACHHCIPSLLKHKTRWLVHFNFWIVSSPPSVVSLFCLHSSLFVLYTPSHPSMFSVSDCLMVMDSFLPLCTLL